MNWITVSATITNICNKMFWCSDNTLLFKCAYKSNAHFADVRNGSSPYVSSVLPQRTSLAIFITGDKISRIPLAFVSLCNRVATVCINRVSNVAASAIACGNDVAPSRTKPCNASSKAIMGMPSLVLFNKIFLNVVYFFCKHQSIFTCVVIQHLSACIAF